MSRSARLLPAVARDERGSVILMSIVLVFVMTLLGLALFDLGAIENRMSLATQADLRAFEVAQAGIERALRELQDGFIGDAAGTESWADNDGVRAPICVPSCVTNAYRPMTLANTNFPGGGSYAVEVLLVTRAQSNATSPYPIGLNCFRNAADVCTNLVFVRSTGTVTDSTAGGATSPAPAGYTASKTIQVLARAYAPSVLANGLVAGTPGALQPVNGNVLIAGSVRILGAAVGGPVPAISWNGAAAGIRNNLSSLTAEAPNQILRRLPAQQAVCPPTATPCAAPNAYSLGAEVQVARPTAVAPVALAGSAAIGGAAGAAYQTGGSSAGNQAGKGPLDAIFIADGCQNSTCSDSYAITAPSQFPIVDMGAIGRAYVENPVSPFPALLASTVQIGGYSGTVANYFATRAAVMTASLAAPGLPGSVAGLTSDTPAIDIQGSFTASGGTPRRGCIRWRPTTALAGTLQFRVLNAASGNACTGAGSIVATAANPLLVYNNGPWRIARGAATHAAGNCPGSGLANTEICYDGVAIVYNTGAVTIEETVNSYCTGTGTCGGNKFPTQDLLVLLTPGNVTVGATTGSVARVMALLFAGTDFISRTAGGTPTRIVGGVAANRFCFGGGGACPGGTTNGPEFYQVPLNGSSANGATATTPYDARALPEEVLALAPSPNGQAPRHWRVESVPRLWLECRPIAPAATLPSTPTGVCSY